MFFAKNTIKLFVVFSFFMSLSLHSMEKILDKSVSFVEADEQNRLKYFFIANVMGLSDSMKPVEAPEQKVLVYNEKLEERPEESLLMRVNPGKDGRQKVEVTTKYPYSCFGQASISFNGSQYGGSGVLVGPHHVLTAAHNLYDLQKKSWTDSFDIYCGLNGAAAPYGKAKGVRAYVPTEYVTYEDKNYDIALVILDRSVGLQVGWLGCLFTANKDAFAERPVHITGYPGDKGFKSMWSMSYPVKKVENEKIFYDIDTYGGQSGSPIWLHMETQKMNNSPVVAGIHTHGEGKYGEGNSGIRLTEYKFKKIMGWIAKTKEIAVKIPKRVQGNVVKQRVPRKQVVVRPNNNNRKRVSANKKVPSKPIVLQRFDRKFPRHYPSFNPQRDKMVSCVGGKAKIWDLKTGECIRTLNPEDYDIISYALKAFFSHKGDKILMLTACNPALIWSVATGRCLKVMEDYPEALESGCFSYKGDKVVTCSVSCDGLTRVCDGLTRVWDSSTGKCLAMLKSGAKEITDFVEFNSSDNLIVTYTYETGVFVWHKKEMDTHELCPSPNRCYVA